MVICNRTLILQGDGNMEPQIFCGYDLVLMGTCDVIGHVVIGLAVHCFL